MAAVAGYVDAVGFLITGGYFVSFMSGNSTRLGVGLLRGMDEALLAASLITSFIAGVVLGASLRRIRRRRPEPSILTLLAGLLALCGYLATHGLELPAALLLALAMGAENTIFAEGGEVRLGLTYMTGALVKIGKGIASTLFREEPYLWAPHLLLWLGLVAGGALGAALYNQLGATALWFAAGAVALMAPASLTIFPRRGDQPSQPQDF